MRRLAAGAASVLAAVALATGCGPGPSGPDPSTTSESLAPEHQFDPAATTITYAFTDSSVPPEYHRSFTLTVEGGVGTIVVDSYGDETARDEQEVSSAVVEDLVDAYNAGELSHVFEPDLPDDEGCAGGQTFALALAEGDTEDSTSIYRCSEESDERALELAEAAAPLLESFDIATLTEDRYRS